MSEEEKPLEHLIDTSVNEQRDARLLTTSRSLFITQQAQRGLSVV